MKRNRTRTRRLSVAAVAAALVVTGWVAAPVQAEVNDTGAVSGTVFGRAIGSTAETVPGVPVTVLQLDEDSGTFEPVPGATDVTDGDGDYLIDGLPEGDYRLCFGSPGQIVASRWISSCYRNAYSVDQARDIEVGPGEVNSLQLSESLLPAFTDVALPLSVEQESLDGRAAVGGHPFWSEITDLALFGVTTGYDEADGSRTFRPGQPVLREQMAAFLYRTEKLETGMEPEVDLPEVSPFTDVPTTHVFYREIVWLADRRITTGYFDGTFRPGQPVLREQMAAFLYRFDGSEFEDGDGADDVGPEFTDVNSANNVFFDEIEWMALEGITTGYDEGNGTRTFRPAQPVLREQMAAFLIRFAEPLIN
ncbi:hypothetical protein HMPREF0063_10483 [Aeromicrobium marinum DSM 15272]|uniref:alpha-amylase n=1 Tax=Aeromicrobium marinum DSM 15272 TaxID=585531 RepID=E2S8X5_9ACTN|nr:S-layer homology domain-containing protein [Aeromicrobium marinum]EFQ84630.1 hypothetical protein HMPREF0063_10483 [Aeromicrobium marinum DSM 15272]